MVGGCFGFECGFVMNHPENTYELARTTSFISNEVLKTTVYSVNTTLYINKLMEDGLGCLLGVGKNAEAMMS